MSQDEIIQEATVRYTAKHRAHSEPGGSSSAERELLETTAETNLCPFLSTQSAGERQHHHSRFDSRQT